MGHEKRAGGTSDEDVADGVRRGGGDIQLAAIEVSLRNTTPSFESSFFEDKTQYYLML